MKPSFIWLGSKRAAKRGVGNKGALLDQSARARLPVPNGAILTHEFYESLKEAGILEEQNGRVQIENPLELTESLYTAVRFPRLNKQVAVRSAFSAEDQLDQSLAGHFTSILNVDPTNPDALTNALCAVWTSALQREGHFRRDVLILEMVDAQVAGVAFSETAYQDDLINYTTGLADKLVSGQIAGESLQIPQLQGREAVTPDLPPFAQRLQRLLRGVRRSLGHQDWDIEWADDGRVCWLIQVRPITRSSRRNEAFTFANLREILPDPPSPFMTSVVEAASTQFFDYYRQFDRTLPENREMVRVFRGRPFFNVTLLTDMMRQWGLPTALVTNSLGGASDRSVGLRIGRFLKNSLVLLRLGFAQLTAVGAVRKATPTIFAQAAQPATSFTQLAMNFRDLFASFVSQMLNLTQALSGPLLILRQTNTLAEHNARQRSIATEIYTDMTPLRQLVANHPAWHAALKQGQPPDDPQFEQAWQAYLQKHGHRGIYESDIARPRYHEAPAPLLISLLQPAKPAPPPPPRSLRGLLTLPIWWQCSRVMQAREQWRYDAIRCYDQVRQQFLQLGEQAVAKGQLPDTSALWLLSLHEMAQLDGGAIFSKAEIAKRQERLADLKTYDFPDLIHAFDDFEQYRLGSAPVEENGRLSGISLTNGTVSGKAWVLNEPTVDLPDGFHPDETILVARSVDPGWIPTFSLVSGVVVEIGGDLSHGSIILREIGLPAITNVTHATKQIQPGDQLYLEAANGIVTRSNR